MKYNIAILLIYMLTISSFFVSAIHSQHDKSVNFPDTVWVDGFNFGPLNIQANRVYAGRNNAVVSGFVPLTFTSLGNNLWQSQTLSVSPNIVLKNNRQVLPGRFPNSGYLFYENSSGNNSITDNQLSGSWVGSELVVRKNNTIIDKGVITSQSGGRLTFNNISPDGFLNGYGFFIQNSIATLDVQDEWAFSSNRIIVYSVDNPSGWKASQTPTLVNLNVSASFHNITFEGANDFAINAQNIASSRITNCKFENIGSFGIRANNVSNLTVSSNTFSTINNVAIIATGCSGAQINNNTIDKNGIEGQGLPLGVTNLEYTAISLFGCPSSVVTSNKISNVGYNGITFYLSNNSTFSKNIISLFNNCKEDGGGIYSWNAGDNWPVQSNIRIHKNIVHHSSSAIRSKRPDESWQVLTYGIYLDDRCSGVLVDSNIVFANASTGIYIHNSNTSSFIANTVYENCRSTTISNDFGAQITIQADNSAYPTFGLTIKKNLFISKDPSKLLFKWDSYTPQLNNQTFIDSNYYSRALAETSLFRVFVNGWPTAVFYDIQKWRNDWAFDLRSGLSPKRFSSPDSLKFFTSFDTTLSVTLGGTWIDILSRRYIRVNLKPYESIFLFYSSPFTTLNLPSDVLQGNPRQERPKLFIQGQYLVSNVTRMASLKIYKMDGRLVKSLVVYGQSQMTYVGDLRGIYIAELNDGGMVNRVRFFYP